jgi:photosystem II stability/assembly factor-like uncharacterized protein
LGDAIYSSSNYGETWTRQADETSEIYNSISMFPTAGVSMSYDGRYQTIVCENIYRSNDYGNTWSTTIIITDPEGGIWDDHDWCSVDMSSEGRYQAAIEVVGEIYISNDYGEHWAKVDDQVSGGDVSDTDSESGSDVGIITTVMTNINWQAISISATGQYMTAVARGGTIYNSSDYGLTWSEITNPNLNNLEWTCVSVSSNAQYQLAGVYGGGLYASKLV